MKRQDLVELLSAHADSLKDGVDLAETLPIESAPEKGGVLDELLGLARRAQAALVPVEPRPDFVAGLQAQLRAKAHIGRSVTTRPLEDDRKLVWVVGGLVYLIGMSMIGLRVAVSALGLLTAILVWWAVRPALAKPRTAR